MSAAGGDPRVRVALLINDLARAGAETQLVELALALDSTAYDVHILLLKQRNDFFHALAARGIPVTALGRRGWWDMLVLWRLYRRLRDLRADVLHCWLFLSNLFGVVAGRLARVPRILVSQRCSYNHTMTPFWRRVARWSHRRANLLIVNSEAGRREEIAAGFPGERAVCVPNGIGVDSGVAGDRAAVGLPNGPLVLTLGQLTPEKGHWDLLQAWTSVRTVHSDARLVLVGNGPLRSALEAQTKASGLGDSVLFLGFRAPATPYIRACDVLVSSSVTEGMPNAVLEAMALGKPVVATRVGGTPELVANGETGLLVPPARPEPLAAALLRLLGDAHLRASLGEAGRRRAEVHFSVEAMTRATEAVYRELLERIPRRSDTARASVPKSTGPTATL